MAIIKPVLVLLFTPPALLNTTSCSEESVVGWNVLLVKDRQGEGHRTFPVPWPRLWVLGPPQVFRTVRMGLEALGDQPLYQASPDEPEVRLGDVGGPCKAPARLGNWSQTPSQGSDSHENTWFLELRGGSAFSLRTLENAESSHTKPVTNTNFFWKAIFRVQLKPKDSLTIHFSFCRRTEGKGKIERTARGAWKKESDEILVNSPVISCCF